MIRPSWAPLASSLVVCLVPCLASLGGAPAALAAPPACPDHVVVLGADLTVAHRAEVARRLGHLPSGRAVYLTESLADEKAQAAGLIPPETLGVVAISSARLTRLPPGRGLTVHTDRSITLDTAGLYANALLTAGLSDADVQVTAPLAAPALGTTALLGLLRAAREACVPLSGERGRLAIRELVFTTHVADAYGATAAADLMARAKGAALAGRITAPAALGPVVDQAVVAARTPLRPPTRASLTHFLADLVAASGRYADLRALRAVRAPSRFLATASRAGPVLAHTYQGVAVAVGNGTLTAQINGVTRTLGHVAGGLVITRNGQPAQLSDVRSGDAVTVTTTAGDLMTRLDARGPPPPVTTTPVTPVTPATTTAPEQGTITATSITMITYTVVGATRVATVRAWPGLVVSRDGRRATLADLRPDDTVTVLRRADGRVEQVDARGAGLPPAPSATVMPALRGTITRVAGGTLTLTDTATGAPRRVVLPATAAITRDGQAATAEELRAGDTVTVLLDDQGAAQSVDARSESGPVRAQPIGSQGWPFVLLAGLIAAGLFLLALRYLPIVGRPLPFAVVERKSSASPDGATPVTCELARRARVLCVDGEEGRLAHVAVTPSTGALLRLIVRDRGDTLREIPATLIASISPSVVRLTITWPDLQDLMEQRAPFSARRYKKLHVARHRPAADAPLLQASADSLRIEVAGTPRP